MAKTLRVLRWMALSAILAALVSCGNGGGNDLPPAPAVTYTAGSFPASSTYANICAAPRSGA